MEVCRLCLDLQSDNNYSPLDGTYKDMVQVVAPELNLEISNAPIVCNECSSNLDELFIFKTRCFEHEEKLRPKCENIKNKFRLKEVLDGTTGGDGTALKKETTKDRICRACLGPIECESFTILKPSEPDAYLDSMLTMCLPELDLELTKDPVMCEACLENLQKLHHFKSTCLDIEDKLASYCESHGTNSSDQINLNSVLESELKMDEDDSDYSNIKSEQFDDESKDTSMKSENDSEMMGDAELKHEEVDIKSETDASAAGSSSDKYDFGNGEITRTIDAQSELERTHIKPIHFEGSYVTVHDKLAMLKCSRCPYLTYEIKHLEDHFATHNRTFSCSDCDFATSCRKILDVHVRKHAKKNACSQCSYVTTKRNYLTNHVKAVHEKLKRFACSQCSFVTAHKCNIRTHVMAMHGPKKQFSCTKCKFATDSGDTLESHVRNIHELPRNLPCSICTFVTVRQGYLDRHMQLIHGNGSDNQKENRKKYACSQCSFVTEQKHYLPHHVKSMHDKIKDVHCSQCKYVTTTKKTLVKHVNSVHKGKRRKKQKESVKALFFCYQCSYAAGRKDHLVTHIKAVHNQRKDFTCSHCSYETSRKGYLKSHLKNVHGLSTKTV